MRVHPKKTIFRIDYKPKLCFYERLYKELELSKHFPHWKTDRLQITFRDYEKRHSIILAHKHCIYESDKYDKKTEEQILDLILQELPKFVDDGTYIRFGLRRSFLLKTDLTFEQLVDTITEKYFSDSFIEIMAPKIIDSTITVDIPLEEYQAKVTIGPARKEEISMLIKFNIDNHMEPDSFKRAESIKDLYDSYPKVALYLDIDYSRLDKNEKMKQTQIEEFLSSHSKDVPKLIDSFESNFFKDKI